GAGPGWHLDLAAGARLRLRPGEPAGRAVRVGAGRPDEHPPRCGPGGTPGHRLARPAARKRGPVARRLVSAPDRRPPVTPPPTGPGWIRCELYQITPEGPSRARLIQPGAELVLCIEVGTGSRSRELVVEFWRGDHLRDRWRQQFGRGVNVALALRLYWG